MIFDGIITGSARHDERILFLHADFDTEAGLWKKEEPVFTAGCKINLFIDGDFSMFIDGVPFDPMYGDICVFPPFTMHCGNVTKPTHINYYQIDAGVRALRGIPGGEKLMEALNGRRKDEIILRPEKEERQRIIRLYEETQRALEKDDKPLAYAKTIEILWETASLHNTGGNFTSVLSKKSAQIVKYISENYAENVSMDNLAQLTGASKSYISRLFKKETGISIHGYLMQYRLARASETLKTRSVTETAYLCGFSDESHFISCFKKFYGITPLKYKNS